MFMKYSYLNFSTFKQLKKAKKSKVWRSVQRSDMVAYRSCFKRQKDKALFLTGSINLISTSLRRILSVVMNIRKAGFLFPFSAFVLKICYMLFLVCLLVAVLLKEISSTSWVHVFSCFTILFLRICLCLFSLLMPIHFTIFCSTMPDCLFWGSSFLESNQVVPDATSDLYKRCCPTVRPSIRPSLRPSVRWSVGTL